MPYEFNKDTLIARLQADSLDLKIDNTNSYQRSYPEFLNYFRDLKTITKHNLIISAHFTYGWMPTIFEFQNGQLDPAIDRINLVKNGKDLSKFEVEELKSLLNNSLVGTSKLLHFIAPDRYPIWDSRVFKYVTGHMPYGRYISDVDTYLNFMQACRTIASDQIYEEIHERMENQVYPITKIRSMEIIMFIKGENTVVVKRRGN